MLDELYAGAFTTASFAGWTTEILIPHGFSAANTLPLVDELRSGARTSELDRDDIEMSLLRMTLLPMIGEVVRLCKSLLTSSRADVAVVSGMVIHGPDGDRVAVREAWVSIGSGDPVSLI